MHAERYRDVGGGPSVLAPWSGVYGNYAEWGGFHVPSSVEVTWGMTDGPFSYARFNITALEYKRLETVLSQSPPDPTPPSQRSRLSASQRGRMEFGAVRAGIESRSLLPDG